MNPKILTIGLLEYVVFLFSTTCHEAAHALVAKWGGDSTAFEGGQVSLNPLPHVQREFFGMVILPLIGILSGSGLIGYASAPYNPAWSIQHPKRAGLMSLAGPAANFLLAILAAILMRVGLEAGFFVPGSISTDAIVDATQNDIAAGFAAILSIFFSLNLLLGCFNLLPIPPLDGFGALSVFTDSQGAVALLNARIRMRGFGMLAGILIASLVLDRVYDPLLENGIRLIYAFYRFPHVQP